MPKVVEGVNVDHVHKQVELLIDNMVKTSDPTGKFSVTTPDGTVVDTKGWNDWEWTHGVGLYGIWKYYELTGEERWLKVIEDWFEARFAEGHKGKNINTMAVFLTLAYVYEKTGKQKYLPWLDSWAEWVYYDLPRTKYGGFQHITYLEDNDQQLWDDTLMMTVMPLAKIGLLLDRPHYVAEAKRQFLLHVQYLFDHRSGLFYHGWTFNEGGHNFADARWARGNSWCTIVIPEFIELLGLDESDPVRDFLANTLAAQAEALKPLQTAGGLWCTLLDVPEDQGSYVESSATAGFAYGLLKAVRRRYISNEHRGTAVKALRGVLDNISPEGELLHTSYGTAMGHDLQHYKDIPETSMPYGQAMAMMALVEFLLVYV